MGEYLVNLWRRIAGAHRSDDATERAEIAEFFWPRRTRIFWWRLLAVAGTALLVFGFLLKPEIINGESMMPTFPAHGFTFCWRGKFWFNPPRRGDVVIVRYRSKVAFLKRVVALPGDVVEFRDGDLIVNHQRVFEPYVKYISDWNLPPRCVKPGHIYVVGDNRSQPIERHIFGQVKSDRIIGAPLF